MEKIKFVMTDTDTQVSAVCRRALEAKGIAVTVCEKNGTKALETLLAVHPQAVLLDAFMPDLDAITVKQRYETQDTRGGHTTFFVTGAFQSEEVEQDLLDNGFSFFFVKPFDENVLVSRVLKAAGSTSRPQPVSQGRRVGERRSGPSFFRRGRFRTGSHRGGSRRGGARARHPEATKRPEWPEHRGR